MYLFKDPKYHELNCLIECDFELSAAAALKYCASFGLDLGRDFRIFNRQLEDTWKDLILLKLLLCCSNACWNLFICNLFIIIILYGDNWNCSFETRSHQSVRSWQICVANGSCFDLHAFEFLPVIGVCYVHRLLVIFRFRAAKVYVIQRQILCTTFAY
jgi:hypothetical protein